MIVTGGEPHLKILKHIEDRAQRKHIDVYVKTMFLMFLCGSEYFKQMIVQQSRKHAQYNKQALLPSPGFVGQL